jgi:cytochrome c-type protein NapB
MRRANREGLRALALALALGAGSTACTDDRGRVPVPDRAGATKSSAAARADRRAYDGAPPVIPHAPLGAECVSCHDAHGVAVPELGFAPPSPHGADAMAGGLARCTQCHVFRSTDDLLVASAFVGLPQDLRRGHRLNPLAPPVIPHRTRMRENCLACHSGPAAREEIRTSHPERVRCQQCHLAVESGG